MKGFLKLSALALLVGSLAASCGSAFAFDEVCESEETCGQYGTAIVL